MSNKEFQIAKQRALTSLEQAKENQEVDSAILPLLTVINSLEEYYTSSSCAGRIVLLEIPEIGDKQQATFLGKWHRPITINEVRLCFKKYHNHYLWMLAQPPIFHIGAASIDAADSMIKYAVASGFKNSGLRSLQKKIILEVCSTERLDAPLGKNGSILCTEQLLRLCIEHANTVLQKSQQKLYRFKRLLKGRILDK